MSSLPTDALQRLAARAPQVTPHAPILDYQWDARKMLDAVIADLGDAGIELCREIERPGGMRDWPLTGCPYAHDHDDSGTYLRQFDDGGVHVGCLHNRCAGKKMRDAPNIFTRTLAIKPQYNGITLPVKRNNDTESSETPEPSPERFAVVDSLDTIEAKEIEWLMPGWLPKGMLTLFGGFAGDGKSTILACLAAIFSQSGILPNGSRAPLVNSLFMTAEEDPQFALRPRLDLHQADLSRVFLMRGTASPDGKTRWANLRSDMPAIRAAILQHKIGMLCIDPVSAYLPGTDRNSEGDMRDAMSGLQELMEETRVAVVAVAHIGKGDGRGRRPEQRLLGSTAFPALARTVWMLNDLPDDHQPESTPDNPQPRHKVLGVVKANYAMKPAPLRLVRPLDGPLKWLGESPVSISESFDATPDPEAKAARAEEWLTTYLAGGSKRMDEIVSAAGGRFSRRVLRDALGSINAVNFQLHGKAHGGWFWRLPIPERSLDQPIDTEGEWQSDQSPLQASFDHAGKVTKRPENEGFLTNQGDIRLPMLENAHMVTLPVSLYRQSGKETPDLPPGTSIRGDHSEVI